MLFFKSEIFDPKLCPARSEARIPQHSHVQLEHHIFETFSLMFGDLKDKPTMVTSLLLSGRQT